MALPDSWNRTVYRQVPTSSSGTSTVGPWNTEYGVPGSSSRTGPGRGYGLTQTVMATIQQMAMSGALPISGNVRQMAMAILATMQVPDEGRQEVFNQIVDRIEETQIRILGSNFTAGTSDSADAPSGGSYNLGNVFMGPFRNMNASEFTRLQQLLGDAGFYGADAAPNFGDRADPGFKTAWLTAINEYMATGDRTLSIEDFLSQKAQMGGEAGPEFMLETQINELTSAAYIREGGNATARSVLGRGLTDAEKQSMVGYIHGLETNYNMAGIDVNTANSLAAQGINLGQVAGSMNPASVAAQAQQLAAQFGLTLNGQWRSLADNIARYGQPGSPGYVDSDHLRGMAVDFVGSQENMDALARWAETQEGNLFSWVGWQEANHYDHVHLSWSPTVGDPSSISNSLAAGSDATQLGAFMQAIMGVESSGGNYEASNPSGAYGAYQFMPETWKYAASIAGINPGDRSPAAQDAAARALMMKYYQQFGDWRLVAAAWHAGPGAAEAARIRGLDYLKAKSDGNMNTFDYVNTVMDGMGAAMGSLGSGMPSPNISTIQNVNIDAELIEELRRRFPHEAEAHDIAGVMNTISGMMGGGGGSF